MQRFAIWNYNYVAWLWLILIATNLDYIKFKDGKHAKDCGGFCCVGEIFP